MVCSGMELLGFLLAVLAIAFVVAKVVFNREVQKAKSTRHIRTPVFREPHMIFDQRIPRGPFFFLQ